MGHINQFYKKEKYLDDGIPALLQEPVILLFAGLRDCAPGELLIYWRFHLVIT